MLGYSECREDTSVVSEQTDIVYQRVFEGLVITEYFCDKQVTTSSTFIPYSNETIPVLSPLEEKTYLQHTARKDVNAYLLHRMVERCYILKEERNEHRIWSLLKKHRTGI